MNLKRLAKRALATLSLSMLCLVAFAQGRQITGTVLDGTGESVIGANVLEVGTTNGVITDLNGNFTLNVQPDAKIQVSFIGYITQTITVGDQSVFKVTLKDDSQALDEVVVIGYQTVKRKDLTGSVASVNSKAISAAPVSNVAQALQGKLPGVNVISQDGRPDAEISIRVRGGGSISQSNEPLILIDGVTGTLSDIPADQVESIDVLKDASSTAIYGARGANGVILVTTKGAKEGKTNVSYNGYAKFNTPTKYLDVLNPYDYVAYTWANAAAMGSDYQTPFEKLFGLGSYATSGSGIDAYRNVPFYDVQREIYNSSFSHSHDLSVSGGTDKTKVLFSLNYMDEEGMKVNSYSKRANVSLKVNQKIRNNMDFGLDVRYTNVNSMSDEGITSGSGSKLSGAYRFRPIAMQDIKGDLSAITEGAVGLHGKDVMWDMYNPYNNLIDYEPLKKRQALRGTASFNWGIVKGLTYHTDLSLNQTWQQENTWSGATYNKYLDETTGEKLYAGAASLKKSDSWGVRWTNTLSYDIDIAKNQHLNVLVGHEVTNSGGTSLSVTEEYFPANFTKENAFAMINQYDRDKSTVTNPFSSSISMPSRILSFFGRLNYNLLDRYLLTVTFRADGSSKFSPNNRWGYFPAAALAWRLSEESFMENTKDWLDNLKVRFSYGQVGNDGISSDLWAQTWGSETDSRWIYSIGNASKPAYDLASTQMANPDLKWETTITRNLGIDFGFLRNRIWGTVDLYWNTTKDLLMNTPLPGITGFTSTYANIGQTSNKGIELSLSGVLYQNKDWNITAGVNVNFNRNNVDKLADNITGLYGTQWIQQNKPSDDYILKEGEPVGMVRGLVYDGYYTTADFNYANGVYTLKDGVADLSSAIVPTTHGIGNNERPAGQIAYPGLPKFRDLDKNGVIDTDDYDIIGNMNAKTTGGFNINANYKNFDLGLYFNWSCGNKVYNANKLASLYNYKESGAYVNKLDILKNSYKIYDIQNGQLVRLNTPAELDAANVNATLPLTYYEMGIVSSLGIENGSYLRLNTLTLGYTLPKSVLNKIGFNNLRIYGTIYNLFTLTGYSGVDPEVNANSNANKAVYPTTGLDWGTYPRARSFVVGLSLNL